MSEYQPKTGEKCGCRRGVQRDNCPHCEGTGMVIDFKAILARGGEDMTMNITQKRIGNRIALLTDSGAEIATLYDDRDDLMIDALADTRLMLDNMDIAAEINVMGLDVQTIRQIDAMPVPDRTL